MHRVYSMVRSAEPRGSAAIKRNRSPDGPTARDNPAFDRVSTAVAHMLPTLTMHGPTETASTAACSAIGDHAKDERRSHATHESNHELHFPQPTTGPLLVDVQTTPAARAHSRRSVQWHMRCCGTHVTACAPDDQLKASSCRRRPLRDAGVRHGADTDRWFGRGTTERPSTQLAALHVAQHQHGGGVRASLTLP